MKKSLPESSKIAKDAKETVQECVSEFICFITSEASDKCQTEKRKTINGEDILWAMSTLGFDKYVEPLKVYLSKYRESVKVDRPEKKSRKDEDGGSNAASYTNVFSIGSANVGNIAPSATYPPYTLSEQNNNTNSQTNDLNNNQILRMPANLLDHGYLTMEPKQNDNP
eukprot:CAMPEP_0171464638 /NCGR_PEP_ID=MMETSP0945-20130129/7898_1 /TAXON_ID=109269 /ORGANISM="Vaucheria litorea, Strain CCMP2940" /LENGTH=167 /DNA_ID=CAMNT_0011991809 /DNA_START=224 /DNA_END=727 /DNA_ORIENTATION=+